MEYTEIEPYRAGSRWFSRDEHYYVVTRTRRATLTLRCASEGCKAYWLLKDTKAGPIVGEHNHRPQSWIPSRNAMFQKLKKRTSMETTPLSIIYEEVAARYEDAAPHLLFDSVAPSMRKWRRRSTQPSYTVECDVDAAHSPAHSLDEETSEATRRLTSNVFNYFEVESSERVRCAICMATVPNLTKLLERHIKDKHPKLLTGQVEEEPEVYLKGEDNDDQEDTEDIYTEVVYLEEEAKDNTEEPRRREKIKRTVLQAKPARTKQSPIRLRNISPKKRPQRRESSSSDEYLVKRQKKERKKIEETTPVQNNVTANEDDYEIDSFGKYITCLLKKLPRSVCRKLQMNIVNLIMSANLEEEQKSIETVPITIQRLPVQTIQGTNYVVVEEKDGVAQNVTVASMPQISNETIPVQSHVTVTTVSNSCDIPASTALSSQTSTAEQEG